MKIILIGFMGSGKSTVAKELSLRLKLPLIEMDQLVLDRTKTKSMTELFTQKGESLLRETEIIIAQEYALTNNIIISTGGGVVQNKNILDSLKSDGGKIFFLNASFDKIETRLRGDHSRPLFENRKEAEALYQFRAPLYLKYADHAIDVGEKTAQEIAEEIVNYGL